MRIALVSDFFLDYVGGAQSSIEEQAAALDRAGHTVALIAHARGAAPTSERSARSLDVRPRFTVPGVDLPVSRANGALIERIERFLVDTGIEVVHAQSEFGLARAAVVAARRLGLPVVLTVHTFYWQSEGFVPTLVTPIMRAGLTWATRGRIPSTRIVRRPSDNLLRNLTVAMAELVDVVVSPSAHQADDLRAGGVTRPIVVAPNPVAVQSPEPRVLALPPGAPPRILWVARCEPEKRPLEFARAVLEAQRATTVPFETDFVGDGSELAALRSLVDGAERIRVHGSLSRAEVGDLIDRASIVALTSHGFDNQPMTIAEASTRLRGVLYCDPNLSTGLEHSGHLAASPSVDDLAASIVELVTHPERLVALSTGALIDRRTFSAEVYVDRVIEVYRAAGARVSS